MNLTKELFLEVMTEMQATDDYEKGLNRYIKGSAADGYIYQPNCVDILGKLLSYFYKDVDDIDALSRFCTDLDYGRKYKDDSVKDEFGKNIDLSSAEKLYEYLNRSNRDKE